jgi:vanillate O-demethylase monooxygenase subunit
LNELIVSQDRPIVESQRPEELPVDLTEELHIKSVDRVSVEYRRWLDELGRDLSPDLLPQY